ncbi:MAG: BON domain-containing protein [Deltaproteobacteria bacterium]|jgi:osmotically-inducible protein OsmY
MNENNELRGVGLIDSDAGQDERSDAQIKDEIERTVRQLLRVQRADAEQYPVHVRVKHGKVVLTGKLPDRGTRRLLVQFTTDIPSVRGVDCSALSPTSLLD